MSLEFPLKTIHGFLLCPSNKISLNWLSSSAVTGCLLSVYSLQFLYAAAGGKVSLTHKVKFSPCWCHTVSVSCCFVVTVNSVQQSCDLHSLNKMIFRSSHLTTDKQQTLALFTEKLHRRQKCWSSALASACVGISIYYLTRRLLSSSSGVRVQRSKKKFARMQSVKLVIHAFLGLQWKALTFQTVIL